MGHKRDGNGAGLGFPPLGSRDSATVGDCGDGPVPGGVWTYPDVLEPACAGASPALGRLLGREGAGPILGARPEAGLETPVPSCRGGCGPGARGR